ncbi:leucine-rich_repeat domain-containing protein [Hexamita inflata]|uniref:Leucine-rich repeat domain-containing protein n=1 Tax=Hexamita inflata TaxID=28002 RepID=A0AA86Q6D1_9EUKA|nr:leucine-rich repeat domain-containing protein [Hexamita inflata]
MFLLHQKFSNVHELKNFFDESQKLEIINSQQMKALLVINTPPNIFEEAIQRNLLSFSQEFIDRINYFPFERQNIEHIYLISFLTNLTELNIQFNKVSDISAISRLKNLRILDLSRNSITDISALQSLQDLMTLDLSFTRISSFTVALPNLVDLNICGNTLDNKSGLEHSQNLQNLDLSQTNSKYLKFTTPQLLNLRKLMLQANDIQEITYISKYQLLQNLDLNYNYTLQNIEPLKYCTQLIKLDLSNTNVTNIKPLQFLKNLQYLRLCYIKIQDIWPLQFMKYLKRLEMLKTQVIDLHPLQHLYKLETIDIQYANVIDVSPLQNLNQLKNIFMFRNKIQNWEPIKHHKYFPELIDGEYQFDSSQKEPTADDLTFYNKILKVHSSHQQMRKIMNNNKISTFRAYVTQKKIYYYVMLNNQTMLMNKEVDLLMQFIQNSTSYLD